MGSPTRFRQAGAAGLQFTYGHFDLAFRTLTFHHRSNQAYVVAETARVLAPGGRWLLADFLATGLMRCINDGAAALAGMPTLILPVGRPGEARGLDLGLSVAHGSRA